MSTDSPLIFLSVTAPSVRLATSDGKLCHLGDRVCSLPPAQNQPFMDEWG